MRLEVQQGLPSAVPVFLRLVCRLVLVVFCESVLEDI